MKKMIFTLIISSLVLGIFAQTTTTPPKTPPKTTTTTPTKPPTTGPSKTPPSPPVQKKEFDAAMADLNDKIASLSRQIGAVSGRINSRAGELELLQSNIDTLNKILQSMNLKVSLTSDSLSITSYSISDLKKKVDDDIAGVNVKISDNGSRINLAYIGLVVLLALIIVFFFLLNHKIGKLSGLEESISEFMEQVKQDFDKTKAEIKPAITKEVQASQSVLESRISRTKVEMVDMISLVKTQLTKFAEEVNKKLAPPENTD